MDFIMGPPSSGKSDELVRRIEAAAASATAAYVGSPSPASLSALRSCISAAGGAYLATVDDFAFAILLENRDATGLDANLDVIDDVRADMLFEDAASHLLTLEWASFMDAQVDPEVPGLRSPKRFLQAAFRLIRKLRDAQIDPQAFLKSALDGATAFYAKPPNFANADLLYYTKETYRDSLDVDGPELQRQYRREVDLAKILANLYTSYLDSQVHHGCLTSRDAVAEAAKFLAKRPDIAAALRARLPVAFVDDAQEMTLGELALLECIYGKDFAGVTFAGDRASTTSQFRGARPDRVFALADGASRTVLDDSRAQPPAIAAACRHLSGAAAPSGPLPPMDSALSLFRATTKRAEAQFIADRIIELLDAGTDPGQIVVLFRSVANVRPYEDALIERNVCAHTIGDVNVFAQREALDALALLWNVHDPHRHEYLLRTLLGPAFALSDASVYTLCSEPPDAQTFLFEPPGEPGIRSGRWDIKRDLRLGWNVLRGDRDAHLANLARERVERFRSLRAGWFEASGTHTLSALARRVWSEGLAKAGPAGSAGADRQQQTLARLHARVVAFESEHPDANLGEFLAFAEARGTSELEAREDSHSTKAVRIASIDAIRGSRFDHVFVANAKAGAFPRWYAPDAFLYSPSLGMIAKENVGDARAARTAKFSYYLFKSKARESYNAEERRAFVYALSRARVHATVTASERATRGVAAPEFLNELQAAALPGKMDLSDSWRPARTHYAPAAKTPA
ncbi:MAG: UvrD-helicase domain-containing protein [Candidatus Eremiobacteraeota bacterium]|nr:UvrD-helicase domain-containing protein [Candidatus Eremiobacteraeota bacterium]